MLNLKKFATLIITAVIVLTMSAPVFKAEATFGECTLGTLCMFKDVYDNPSANWLPGSTTGTVGNQYIFRIGIWNTTGAAVNNVIIKDTLPAGLSYVPVSMVFSGYSGAFTDTDLFGAGINIGTVANNASIQLQVKVKVDDMAAGTFTLTNTGSITSSAGNKSDTAAINVTSTGPASGKLAVNEINFNPKADWSDGGEYRLSGRTAVDADDQFIELYIKNNGLNLTSADWQMFIDNGSASSTAQLLAAGTSFQYISTTGGTQTSTKTGDYVLINNPLTNLDVDSTIRVSYLGVSMDETAYATTNTNLLDETLGRNAASLDTNNTSDFSKNHGTPGRANTARVDNTYEAEIYMASDTGAPRGADVFDAAASEGIAVAVNGLDINGEVFGINEQNESAAGHYRITLRAKVDSNAGSTKVGAFWVKYPNARNVRTGFELRTKDFAASNTYQDFTIEIAKPTTTGQDNNYSIEFANASGRILTIDKVTVSSFGAWNSTDCPSGVCSFEAENYFSKTGTSVNDAAASGGKAMLATGGSIVTPALDHVFYGPYSARFVDLGAASSLEATYRLKFTNITAPGAGDRIARLEVTNPFPNQRTTLDIYKSDITNANYNDYKVQFISSLQGSYQLRVISFGNSDVSVDRVSVKAVAGAKVIYESEGYEGISGLIGTKITDALAANGFAMQATTAMGTGWIQANAPSYTDFVGSGMNLKATFRLRSTAAAPADVDTVDIRVYHHAIDGSRTMLASKTVSGALLTNTAYRDFELTFAAPAEGTLSYRIYFRPSINIVSDRVTVESQTIANPKVRQAEYFRNIPGTVVTDALATANTELGGARFAVRGTGTATTWLLAGGPNEIHPAGNYTITYYLRKSGPGGSPSATMGKIQVKDPGTGLVVAEQFIQEADINNTGYTAVTLPVFTKATAGRIDTRFVYYGSLTTFDLFIDKVEISRAGGF